MDILELQNKISEYLNKKGLEDKDIYFLLDDLADQYKENIMAENESDDPDDTLDDEDEDYTDEDEEIPEEDENNYEEEDYDEENIVEDSIKSMNEEKQKNIIKRPKIPIIKKARRVERPTVNI